MDCSCTWQACPDATGFDARDKCGLNATLCWSFGRSVKHVVPALDAAAFMITATIATLERDIIVERVMAGLGRARI